MPSWILIARSIPSLLGGKAAAFSVEKTSAYFRRASGSSAQAFAGSAQVSSCSAQASRLLLALRSGLTSTRAYIFGLFINLFRNFLADSTSITGLSLFRVKRNCYWVLPPSLVVGITPISLRVRSPSSRGQSPGALSMARKGL